jgi:ribosomal protein S6
MKTYDGLFIFDSRFDEAALDKACQRIEGEIKKLKGAVLGKETLGKRTFARPMKKQENGQYMRITFQLEPADVHPLQARLKLNEEIFRVQILCAEGSAVAAEAGDEKGAGGE